MPIHLRRIRALGPVRYAASPPDVDPTVIARTVARLVAAESARMLLSDEQLRELAIVSPQDERRAVLFWDEAQRRARTGLAGLLDSEVTP